MHGGGRACCAPTAIPGWFVGWALRFGDASYRHGGGIYVSVTLPIIAIDDIFDTVTLLDCAGTRIIVSVTLCIPCAAVSPFG